MVKNKKSALGRGVERKVQEKLDSAIRKTLPVAAGGPIDEAKSPSNAGKKGDQDRRSKARFCPIVGIGASAGGLLAFTQLLAHLPADTGMAFVLVQHLDPRHESILAELLSSHTQMPVVQVEQGMTVEPDHIYVIPLNTEMTILQRVLTLTPRSDGRERYMPIDFFLCSLAEDQRSNAIGVILSGTATDGILGLKAIKSAGGVTFAQDDKSAQFNEMPRSAVATGSVDFISPPEGIAKELASIASHLLQENPAEVQALFKDILINVTDFFRDADAFDALKNEAFPAILKSRLAEEPAEPIRVWVPGCSTGEEVYSIAICLLEFLEDSVVDIPVQIFATDISEEAIEKARAGIYGESVTATVSPERLRRFFVKANGAYQISNSVREICVFSRQDVTKAPPFSRIDLISCRSLLIYLGPVLQKRILALFHYALKLTGFLMLGHSETIDTLADQFSPLDKKHKLYSVKVTSTKGGIGLPFRGAVLSATAQGNATGQQVQFPKKGGPGLGSDWEQKEADRILLAQYVPSGIIVNEDLKIIEFGGQIGPYLGPSPGEPSFHLTKMVCEELILSLRTAIDDARDKDVATRREGMEITHNGQFLKVNLSVIPFKGHATERHFLILFEDFALAARTQQKKTKLAEVASSRGKLGTKDRQIEGLGRELAATRQYLQSIIDELRSANEEAQSSNEELQSTNEELQTAKEELQSVNEELSTMNEEMQGRNTELGQVNNDLVNLLASINIPIVMIGNNLRIRRFTPMSEKVLNLIPTDIGRPIMDIKPNVNVPDLEELLAGVINNLDIMEREVQDREGHWYSMRMRPYRTTENKITGVVMQLLDIDALKRSAEQMKRSRDYAEAIVETVREPLVVLDEELRVKNANRSFYQIFHSSREATENKFIYELGNGQWNTPKLRQLLEDTLPATNRFQDFEIEHEFEHTGWRILLLNARRIHQDGGTGLILLAMEDITDRKQAAEARYRRLFEAAKDGIVILDADSGDVAEVNPVAVALLGYSREELLGKKLWDIDPLKDDEAIQSGFQELLQKGIIRYPDLALKAKDGRRTDVEIVGNVYREGDKKVVQFNIRDITARKRAEENLRANEEQLRQALKMEAVGRLTGGVAHDFNNVLEAILGYSDLMLSRLRKEPIFNAEFVDLAAACRKDLQEIVKAGTKAASLTRQLLAFGRKQVLQTKVLDLNAVVTDINEMLRRVISEDIELINNLDPALGRTKADPGQIEQVILNLAINSRDAMPKGGKLKIETANVDWDTRQAQADLALESGRYVMLAVSDTGSGMDAETRSHLFEPFFTTKPKGAGTGLGLSTVYGIVQQSGGTICVCSEPGSGTSLKIYFPRVDEPAELDQHEAPSSPPSGSETILVVEDEDGVRALAGELIRRGGYTVLEASGGVDAIRICEQYQGPIHLMLTDVIMPRMSGVELAEGVANLRPKMKVLFMSGHPEDAIVAHGVLNPDTAFLSKPFTTGALAIRIREVLGGALRDISQPNRERILRDVPAVRLSKKG
jgi:two-component system, chemotaxis family, CheB/CheR fusion protein